MSNIKRFFRQNSIHLVILLLAMAKFALHIFTGARYGFFVDEFYTIALSKHLAFGYVDVPPLAPLLAALSRTLFGESIQAMHILPALAGSVTLVFVCLITKEFGGKAFAVFLSGFGFLVSSVWLIIDSYFSYDAFDQLVLAAFLYVLVIFIHSGNPKIWLLLGLLAGIACMTKMTLLYLGPGFLVALSVSKYRKDLLTPWPWLGTAICMALVSPYLLWQVDNGWPTLTYWINYGTTRLQKTPLLDYGLNMIFNMNPVLLPLYGAGLYRIFRRLRDTNYSFLGWMFLVSFAVLFLFHAKTWMLAELFIPLIAAGAVGIEEFLSGGIVAKVLKPAIVALLLAGGILYAPSSLPILPIESLPAYFDRYEFLFRQSKDFTFAYSRYPLNIALRIGWEDLVKDVVKVYNELSPEDQKVAGIYTLWYGPASAIDYYSAQYGLPHAVSGHLNYYLWGPGPSWEVMIILINRSNTLSPFFRFCEKKGTIENEYTIPLNQLNIYVCRKPYVKPEVIWKNLETYY